MKIIAVKLFQLFQQLHCDDLHIILSLSAVQIYDYFIYSYSVSYFFEIKSCDFSKASHLSVRALMLDFSAIISALIPCRILGKNSSFHNLR